MSAFSAPRTCSLSDHTCLGTPGNDRYNDASSAAKGVNIGIIIGSVGAAALVGGIVWYTQGAHETEEARVGVAPWIDATSAGFAVSGRL